MCIACYLRGTATASKLTITKTTTFVLRTRRISSAADKAIRWPTTGSTANSTFQATGRVTAYCIATVSA